MIDRMLDRAFLLASAEQVRAELERRTLDESDEDVTVADAHAALLTALNGEPRAYDDLTPEARKAFVPRDASLSLLQSTMEEWLREHHAEVLRPAPGADDAGGPLATTVVETGDLDETLGDFTSSTRAGSSRSRGLTRQSSRAGCTRSATTATRPSIRSHRTPA